MPNMQLFRGHWWQKLCHLEAAELGIDSVATVQELLSQMLKFESLKQNKQVRDLLKVNETLEAPREHKN